MKLPDRLGDLAEQSPALFMWLIVLPVLLLIVFVLSLLGVGFGDSYATPPGGW